MIRKSVRELKGNEVLAKALMTANYQTILPKGAILREDYIERLLELDIFDVFIEEEKDTRESVILKSELKNLVKIQVKDILERHTYRNNEDLVGLIKTAEDIVASIVEEQEVVEKIFDIKNRSTDIYEHSVNVCSFAILTALKMKLDKNKIHHIGVGCLLHDIGLRYTTIDFHEKDVSSLNKQEMAEYRKHPVYGYTSLKEEDWISDISKNIILHHHETMDGLGFPLRMKDIPLECRIVNICDTFDEMICGISSKQMKVYQAIEYLKTYKNQKFDGQIVDIFLGFTAVYPVGTQIITNEGELAEVVAQNKTFHDRPVLRILKDKNGNEVQGEVIKNLMKVHNIFIEKVLD